MRQTVWFLIVSLVSLVVAPSPLLASASTISWATVAPMPTARVALAAVAGANGRIYAIGGVNGGLELATVEAFDPSANAWSRETPMPTARGGLVAVAGRDNRIYAIGGSLNKIALSTVEAFDPQLNSWSVEAPMPTPRWGAAAAAGPDGSIYVIGGCSGQTCDGAHFLKTAEAYTPSTNTWRTVAPLLTGRVFAAAAAGGDGRIYVMGGCCKPSNGANDPGTTVVVEAYTVSTNTWAPVASLPAGRYGLAAAAGPDGQVYAIGGTNYPSGPSGSALSVSLLSSVDSFSPKSDAWNSSAPMPTARADLASATGSDGRIYAIGGRTGGFNGQAQIPLATVEVLSLPGSPLAGPPARSAPCQFVLGFKSIHDLIPDKVAGCLGDEGHNPANGDALQATGGGLLVWRKHPHAGTRNWTAFTDGYRTWINGPNGLQERLNTQRFRWEANPDGLPMVG